MSYCYLYCSYCSCWGPLQKPTDRVRLEELKLLSCPWLQFKRYRTFPRELLSLALSVHIGRYVQSPFLTMAMTTKSIAVIAECAVTEVAADCVDANRIFVTVAVVRGTFVNI